VVSDGSAARTAAPSVEALRLLTAGLWLAAVVLFVPALITAPAIDESSIALLGLLCAAGLLSETFAIPISDRVHVSTGNVSLVVAAVLLGPAGAAIVGFVQILSVLPRPPFAYWLAHAPLRTLCGLAGGAAAVLVEEQATLLRVALAALAVEAVDFAGNAAILHVRGADVRAYASGVLRTTYLPFTLSLPIIWLIALAYDRSGLSAAALVVAPSLLAQYVVWLFVQRDRAFETLSKANLGFAISLIRALEAADAYTAGHSAAVAVYARDVARELGYSESDAAIIQLAALLHDVGKIGVPTEVLRKPTRLDEDEWRLIQQHPITGERIVGEIPVFRFTADAIRHHHERPDGTGYPDGMSAPTIPRSSLVIGVVDAYSAMTQPRSYRGARPPDAAIEELERCRGDQFEVETVDAFLRVLARGTHAYRMGEGPEFELAVQREEILDRLHKAGLLRTAVPPV
jgi:putative nucleotidyltransferase with HDIG domain